MWRAILRWFLNRDPDYVPPPSPLVSNAERQCRYCDDWLQSLDAPQWGWCRWVDREKKMPPGFVGHAAESNDNTGLETTAESRCNAFHVIVIKRYDTGAR